MVRLRVLLLLLAAVVLPAPVSAETIGVTAAVNQSAKSTPPGGAIRALTLGANVIENERISTDAVGLVQVLFADGTTLTLGPRSDLVIDRFIYDPNKGTAEMAATMTKGVLRFIGGAASKGDNGVAITIPTGTIGIRGAITDISLDTSGGNPPHVDMLFGKEVTYQQGLQLIARIYQGGYSLSLGPGGAKVVKTPPQWASQIQAALAGGAGTNGGASSQPTNQTVANSGVPGSNSSRTIQQNDPPQPMPRDARPGGDTTPPPRTGEVFVGDDGVFVTRQGGGAALAYGLYAEGYDGLVPLVTATDQYAAYGTPIPSSVTLDSARRPVAANLIVELPGCPECRLDVTGANGQGTATIYNYFEAGAQISFPVEFTMAASKDIALPAGTQYCTCAFLDWGTWNMQGTVQDPYNGDLEVAINNGTWFVGDVTSPSQLAGLASTSATFTGHAIGAAQDFTTPSPDSRLVSGDMTMQWSFGSRSGTMNITGFDGRDFSGGMFSEEGSPYFLGGLSGAGYSGGVARGSFVNDGATPAAGVAGDFVLVDEDWGAAGIFVGKR